MKKTMLRIISFLLIALLLVSSGALAEIKRGDRGEEVFALQQMLLEMGWLYEDPDGIFGKNTQQAVMDFEETYAFPADGIVDDRVLEAICVAYDVAMEESGEDYAGEDNGVYDETVRLNGDIIICGTDIYYSGAVSGDDPGVYVIDADTRNVRLLSDMRVNLAALCYENLLVNRYMEDGDAYALTVLDRDGAIINVNGDYARSAIAGYDRFYWGGGSCSWDGSDARILFSEAEAPFIFSITVEGEYLYYEDGNAMKDRAYMMDEDHLPGAQLWRMNLEDGSRQMIADVGSRFLGIEDNRLYFVRESFGVMTDDTGEMAAYEVDEGVYRAELETLNTVCLWKSENTEDSYTLWRALENGVIYGEYRDYTEGFVSCIVRIDTDGNIIFELPIYDDHTDFICIANGVWYAVGITGDGEVLVCVDLETGEQKILPFENTEVLYFAEGLPQLAVAHDRIYYYCYDEPMEAYCLKSMDFDGGDKALYAWENAF